MIRFHLKKMIADKEFKEGRRVRMDEIAKATGIHRTTLSKIANVRAYNTTTDVVDGLCRYFGCEIKDIMEYVPDEDIAS